MFINLIYKFGNPLIKHGLDLEYGRFPLPAFIFLMVHIDHQSQITHGLVATFPVGLVDQEDIADLKDAGLDRLDIISHSGNHHNDCRMGAPDNIYLILADTNGFDQDIVLAHGIQDINGASGRLGQSPEMTSCGQRPDKNALIHTVSLHPHTVS